MKLSKKGRHPALDAGSPFADKAWRYRIGVRYDGTDSISTISRHFWQASDL